jgi:hypothetical protein
METEMRKTKVKKKTNKKNLEGIKHYANVFFFTFIKLKKTIVD